MTEYAMMMDNGQVVKMTLAFERSTARRMARDWNAARDREITAKLVMPRAFLPAPRCVALIVANRRGERS